jgi:HK97 gp10 family phage protein
MSLKSRLPQIAARLDNIVDQGARDVAEAIVKDAQERVPVASGDLRDSIHAERTEEGYAVLAGDSDTPYGHLVEFGTSNTPAHPFLIPAMEGKRASVKTLVAARWRSIF